MALNPALRKMLDDAKAKYDLLDDPLEAKRNEILARQADNYDQPEVAFQTVMERLALIGLRKATKRELRCIIVEAMVTGA